MDHLSGLPSVPHGRPAERETVIEALRALNYDFDPNAPLGGEEPIRGYAPGSVVEVVGRSSTTVSLLFSAELGGETLSASMKAVIAVAAATGVEFLAWLSAQMRRRGRHRPWTASRRFAQRRVSARYLNADAMLLTVEARA